MIDDERNYKIHNAERLAIVESFRDWRHYLEKPYHILDVPTDHSNIHVFMSKHKVTQRLVRWSLDLSAFDFWLVNRKRTLDPTESISH